VIRLGIRVHRARAETALAELLGLAPTGVEEVELPGGLTEYAVYGAPGELPELAELEALLGPALVGVARTTVADDWS
jgi:ribosomal protein L11 methyltransferase